MASANLCEEAIKLRNKWLDLIIRKFNITPGSTFSDIDDWLSELNKSDTTDEKVNDEIKFIQEKIKQLENAKQ